MEVVEILSRKKNSIVKLIRIGKKDFVAKYYLCHSRSMFIELNIMATCKHQNIISMERLLVPDKSESIGILMQKENDNYIDLLDNNKWSMIQKINYLLQIAHGIRYLHHNHIVHMDLKSENIMVSNDICKIIDFGSAEYLMGKKIYTCQLKCTATHRPPEAFNMSNNNIFEFDSSFDIWSFGVIIFETLSGIPMYKHHLVPKYDQQNYQLSDNSYDNEMHKFVSSVSFGEEISKVVPKEFQACFNHCPNFRPKIDNVILELTLFYHKLIETNNISNSIKFDNSTQLNIVPIRKKTIHNESFAYYHKIVETINHMYRDIHPYPKFISNATFNLIHRLNELLDGNKLNKKYIDQAILLCYQFSNNDYIIPFENIIPMFNKRNKDEIINDIIIATNGVLFQHECHWI